MKKGILAAFIMLSLLLVGCGEMTTPRIIAREKTHSPKAMPVSYKKCQYAIYRDYLQMNYLKIYKRHMARYIQWDGINNELASALSAMQFNQYAKCYYHAQNALTLVHAQLNHIGG